MRLGPGLRQETRAVQLALVFVMIAASGALCAAYISVPLGEVLFGVGFVGVVISGVLAVTYSYLDRKR